MEYTQNFYRNYNIKIKALVKICKQYMKSPLCYEVRSCEFPLRTGAISLFSSTTFANACIVYVGRAGRRIPSAHGNRSLFLLSIFITLLFLCWGRERNSLYAQGRFHCSLLLRLPMPVLFMWEERVGEFLLRTVTALSPFFKWFQQ